MKTALCRIGVVTLTLAIMACSQEPAPEAVAERVTGEGIKSGPGTSGGQWEFLGGDAAHTRYSPADEITPDNFEDLEEAWAWDGSSFNAQSGRSTPSYINGTLYTVAGPRRYVVALDPATSEQGTLPLEPELDCDGVNEKHGQRKNSDQLQNQTGGIV